MSLASGYGNRVPFRDPVWYAGLLGVAVALGVCVARRRWREAVFVAPVLVMTVLMLVVNPGLVTQWNGWYRLAIYPLVYVGAAWLVVELGRLAGAQPRAGDATATREPRLSGRGDGGNRTHDGGFADLCLTTWLRRPGTPWGGEIIAAPESTARGDGSSARPTSRPGGSAVHLSRSVRGQSQ